MCGLDEPLPTAGDVNHRIREDAVRPRRRDDEGGVVRDAGEDK
jgi:hypothetical protein